ncbi:MAG: sodium:proton antiporter [Comamonadaceae bacterium]|nr:MAG: sodium:proton antiporter [Comamonadaceae bacterium]
MDFALWSVIGGLLLVVMALSGSVLARLPLSTSMLYLLVGMLASPLWLGLVWTDPAANTKLLEHLTEAVVLVSLFTAGLKLSPGLKDRRWLLPLRLAVTSMVITVLLIAAAGMMLGLSVGAAILLGAILAPTDPVLASDVQVHTHGDRDRLRFSLTGEAGLNDGTAFPFVMLGLGLLGLHDIGSLGWRWLAIDVLWASACGLVIGAALGAAIGRLVLHLRRKHQEAVGLDEFLAMGLIGLSYGCAVLAHGYGFLAVFAAGVALRQLEQQETAAGVATNGNGKANANAMPDDDVVAAASAEQDAAVAQAEADPRPGSAPAEALAVDQQHAPAFLAHALLGFNEKLERIGEMVVVIAIGSLLWAVQWPYVEWWFVPVLLVIIRPVAVSVGLIGSSTSGAQRWLMSWFGIRGIGSLYYLMYAINHGLEENLASELTALTLAVVVTSIFVHGISVTPLMAMYERRRGAKPPS